MIASQILGLVAIAALLLAACVGRDILQKDSGLRLAVRVFLFCAVAALATAYVHQPWIVWPLATSMLGAMLLLVYTMHCEAKRKKPLKQIP